MIQPMLQIELNEVNFDFVVAYGAKGELPELNRLIAQHGLVETVSESEYDRLEPWIQWVSAHSGLTLAEHGVFRLGDIVDHDEIDQIWEVLEGAGQSVGAISPMNAANRCKDPLFFIPDPWTKTSVKASPTLNNIYRAVVELVNENAQQEASRGAVMGLLPGLLRYARPINYLQYLSIAAASVKQSWRRAMILDLLLSDIFITEVARSRPDYATLFLNAAAHIQHHYMFDSSVYDGVQSNPDWYCSKNSDPLLEIYRLYDRLIGQIRRRFDQHRIVIATGLHQDPYPKELFYWRLKDHAQFLDRLEIAYDRVEPRMSRDFVVFCANSRAAREAQLKLEKATADDGVPLFEIDNRGDSLFVMLVYPNNISPDMGYGVGNRRFDRLHDEVAFVAIKNGEHNGIGYLVDTGQVSADSPATIPLTDIFQRTLTHFNVPHHQLARGDKVACIYPVGEPAHLE